MKALQLGRFYPPSKGGVETAIFNIREGLADSGVSCDVLCCARCVSSSREAVNNGTIYRAGSLATILSTSISPAMILTLRRIASQYDIIHIHHPDPMASLALFIVRPKAKVIVHWHSDIVRQKVSLCLFKPLQTWLLKYATSIIVTTPPYLRSPFLKNFLNKTKVVPLGIDPQSSQTNAEMLKRITTTHQNKFLVFSIGRMVYYKGFEYLIKAALKTGNEVNIVIGGDGPLLNKLRFMVAKLDLTQRVFLPGSLCDEEVEAYYQVCDVFCLSSTHKSEAFGIVQLEAMKYAKPIIATTIPDSGVSWVNADRVSGINIRPSDRDSLADAIKMLAHKPSLAKRWGEQGQRRLYDLFTRERMCQTLHQLYTE